MEYAAFLKLRISKPELPRPYRVPLNTFGCFLWLVPTFAIFLLIMALADFSTLAYSFLTVVFAVAIFHVRQREMTCCGYTPVPTNQDNIDNESLPSLT